MGLAWDAANTLECHAAFLLRLAWCACLHAWLRYQEVPNGRMGLAFANQVASPARLASGDGLLGRMRWAAPHGQLKHEALLAVQPFNVRSNHVT